MTEESRTGHHPNHLTKTNRKKIPLIVDDHDADPDTLFQPKRSAHNLHATGNGPRDSHSLTSSHLSLTDVSPLTDRTSSFEFINMIGSDNEHVFGIDSDAENAILSDSHDEEFLSIYSSDRRYDSAPPSLHIWICCKPHTLSSYLQYTSPYIWFYTQRRRSKISKPFYLQVYKVVILSGKNKLVFNLNIYLLLTIL